MTKSLKGGSLKSALRLMLRDLGLAYVIRDDVLLITTTDVADFTLTTKSYDVADLVVYLDQHNVPSEDYEPLIDAIQSTVFPNNCDQNGRVGSIVGANFGTAKVLVVSQTYEVHGQIAELLKGIREIAKKNPDAGLPHRNKRHVPQDQPGAINEDGRRERRQYQAAADVSRRFRRRRRALIAVLPERLAGRLSLRWVPLALPVPLVAGNSRTGGASGTLDIICSV